MDQWQEMAQSWNDLLARSCADTPFLTWEWLYSWAECFLDEKSRLFILCIHHGETLVGIAPLYIRHGRRWGLRYRRVGFLGAPDAGSDYLDVFAQRGYEREVALQVYAFIHQSRSEWEEISLTDIPSESLFLLHFLEQSGVDGKHVAVRPAAFCPIVSLPSSEEAFWSARSSKRRYQVARDTRMLEQKGKLVHQVVQGADVTEGMETFYPFCRQHGLASNSFCAFLQKIVSRFSGRGWLQLVFLKVDQQIIGVCLHLCYQRTLFGLVMAINRTFDKRISLGNLMLGLNIQKAIAERFSVYDFLKGTEAYKFHWANGGRRALTLTAYGKKPASLLALMEHEGKALAKTLLR